VGALTGLFAAEPVLLERWFAAQGAPPSIDLARSGAPELSTADILTVAGPEARDEYLGLPLGYGHPVGEEGLRAAIERDRSARHADEVIVTTGATEALLLAAAAALAAGEQAAVGVPAHGGVVRALEATGAHILRVPVWRPGSSRLDLSGLFRALQRGASVLALNSPHNPTGAVADGDELAALIDACTLYGARILVDEVALSTLNPHAESVTRCPEFISGTVVAVGDLSKSLGLGGLRIGWLTCADHELLGRVTQLKDITTLGTSVTSQFLAALALENRATLARQIAALATRNRDALGDWVMQIGGAEYTPPADGLVAFPLLPMREGAMGFVERLRATAGVSVVPGVLFGVPSRLRLGLGLSPGVFTRGLERIAVALG